MSHACRGIAYRVAAYALLVLLLARWAIQQPPVVSASNAIVVTQVAVNNSSAKISFTPVAGAKDYRIYDVANPTVVKYAGTKRWQPAGSFRLRTVNNDGVHFLYPLQLESMTGAAPLIGPNLTLLNNDVPMPQIEWNKLDDHQPHQLVVEAVDALGPAPLGNLYNFSTFAPTHPQADTMLGMNDGMTADGKMSINGQGLTTDTPNVIVSSAPFTVQANGSVLAIPSGPDATQTFLDTFDSGEGASITQTGSTAGQPVQPPGGTRKTYSVNAGTNHAWTIQYEAADPTMAQPSINDGHFMDVLFDQAAGASWATMAMTPQARPDISNGGMLHMTMEVDGALDYAGRRWFGFNIAPAADPIVDHVEPNYGAVGSEQVNATNNAIFVSIYAGLGHIHEYLGQVTPPLNVDFTRVQHFPNNGLGFDNRSRFDLFMTQTHLALYEDGGLVVSTDLPQAVRWTTLSTNFAHYFYHSGADLVEEPFWAPWDHYLNNTFPESDERHWDNMGQEVLPAGSMPAGWTNLSGLVARVQPAGTGQCVSGWQCSDIGQPLALSSSVQGQGSAFTLHAGASNPVTVDPDEQLLVAQPQTGDIQVTARVTDHANLSYWGYTGQAGVELRQSTDDTAPFYFLGPGGSGHLVVLHRDSAGGPIVGGDTAILAPLPIFVRVARQGNSFSGSYSADGMTWTPVLSGTAFIAMPNSVLAGLTDWEAQSPDDALPAVQGTAVFDNVGIHPIWGRQ